MKRKKKKPVSGKLFKNSFIMITILLSCFVMLINKYRHTEAKKTYQLVRGEILSINHAANLIDEVDKSNNIVFSPVNYYIITNAFFNGSSGKTTNSYDKFLNISNEKLKKVLLDELNTYEEEQSITNYELYYEDLIDEFYKQGINNLSIQDLTFLSKDERKKIILLNKKLELTYQNIINRVSVPLKNIKKYILSKDELSLKEYKIKQLINTNILNIESYNLKTKVINKNYIFYNQSHKLLKDFINLAKEYKIVLNSYNDNYNLLDITSKLNSNIKKHSNIKWYIDEFLLIENNFFSFNSLEFNSLWNQEIDCHNKKYDEFYYDNQINIAEYMYEYTKSYYENDYAIGFKKDFKNNEFSFIGILPKEDEINKLSYIDIEDLLKKEVNKESYISFPKFIIESEIDLKSLYQSLSQNIFNKSSNYQNISKSNPIPSKIIQKNTFTIGEKGTASCSNENIYFGATIKKRGLKSINFNKPFYYLIINNKTNQVLLVGKFNNP